MCAITGSGCGMRPSGASGTSIPRSRSRRRWWLGARASRPLVRPEEIRRPEAHRHRLALGAHGEEPEPGLCQCRCAARLHLHALHQGGQGGIRRAGDREGGGYRFTVKVGEAEGCGRRGEERHQAGARSELSVPDVGCADRRRLHQGRRQGRADGCAADGHRCRGRARARLSAPTPEMEAVARQAEPEWKPEGTLAEDARWFTPTLYRPDDLRATSSPLANSWR